jgi:hypothetical protein
MKLVQTLEKEELFETLDLILKEFHGVLLESKAKVVEYGGAD